MPANSGPSGLPLFTVTLYEHQEGSDEVPVLKIEKVPVNYLLGPMQAAQL